MASVTDYIRQALALGRTLVPQQDTQLMRVNQAAMQAAGRASPEDEALYRNFPTLAFGANTGAAVNAGALRQHLARSGEQAAALFEVFGGKSIAQSIRKDPSGAAAFFSENGGAMPLLAAMAKQGASPVSAAAILRAAAPQGITDAAHERIVREALLAGGHEPSDVDNLIEGHRAGGPMPTMVQSGQQNVGISPYGQRVEQIGGVPIGGPRTPPATVNINTPVDAARNALAARRQLFQEVRPLQEGLDRIATARGSLALARSGNAQATRTLITNVEQAIQPGNAVLVEEFQRVYDFGDLGTRLSNWTAALAKGTLSETTLNEIDEVLGTLERTTRASIATRQQSYAPYERAFEAESGIVGSGFGEPVPSPEPPPATAPARGRVEQLPDGTTIEWLEE